MTYTYRPRGICASMIEIEVEDNKVQNLEIMGGCPGNHLGLAALTRGMEVDEVIKRMEGIRCGFKSSSCPDQVAQALKKMKSELADA